MRGSIVLGSWEWLSAHDCARHCTTEDSLWLTWPHYYTRYCPSGGSLRYLQPSGNSLPAPWGTLKYPLSLRWRQPWLRCSCTLFPCRVLASSGAAKVYHLCPLEQWLKSHLGPLKPQLVWSRISELKRRKQRLEVVMGSETQRPTSTLGPSFETPLSSWPWHPGTLMEWEPQRSLKCFGGHFSFVLMNNVWLLYLHTKVIFKSRY